MEDQHEFMGVVVGHKLVKFPAGSMSEKEFTTTFVEYG